MNQLFFVFSRTCLYLFFPVNCCFNIPSTLVINELVNFVFAGETAPFYLTMLSDSLE